MTKAQQIHRGLAAAYPEARCELDYATPFELLVATVLSAQSTDRRVNTVTPALFARFGTPETLAQADLPEVQELIKPVGFHRSKAASLIGLSAMLVSRFDAQVPVTLDELIQLPGVGRKTANVVLGEAFGIPGVTPDTHLIRLAGRFGWVTSIIPDQVERAVQALFAPIDWVPLCHRVIWHGRRCCHARRPACGACPVSAWCPSRDLGEQDPRAAAKLIRDPRR